MIKNCQNPFRKSFFPLSFFVLISFLSFRSFKNINLNNIKIIGSEVITKEDIITNSSIKFPERLINIKTKLLEKELKKNLSLKNISITREILPFGLRIIIQSREPIAKAEKFLEGNSINGYIDIDGIFIPYEYADLSKETLLPIKFFIWNNESSDAISKILEAQKKFDINFTNIFIYPDGSIVLEEKTLKKILLGFDSNIIDIQLILINNLKDQLKNNKIIKNIESIDLSDPSNPEIKVFKP